MQTVFIYDVNKYDLDNLLNDERLIASIMSKDITMSMTEAKNKIRHAYNKLDNYKITCKKSITKKKQIKTFKSYDHSPCTKCGNN